MAKKKSWLFYTAIVTASVILFGKFLWELTPMKNEFEAYFIQKLQPYLGESFLINDFSVGPNSISIYDVRAADQQATFALELEEIRIDYDLLGFLRAGLDAPNVIKAVTFRGPRFHLYHTLNPKPRDNVLSPEQIIEEILRNLKKIPEIDHIAITEGQFIWHVPRDLGNPLPADQPIVQAEATWLIESGMRDLLVFDQLGGKLKYELDSKQAFVELNGQLSGIEQSMVKVNGVLDFAAKNWKAALTLDECDLTSDWPFWKIDFFKLHHAWVQGRIDIENRGFSPDSLSFNGLIDVRGFDAHLFNQKVDADTMTLRFEDQGLVFEPFNCRVEDGSGRFWGTMKDFFTLEVDWHFELEDYSIPYLYQSVKVMEYAYDGKMHGNAHIYGPLRQVQIAAVAKSPAMLYAVIPFDDVEVHLQYNNITKQLDFPYARGWFMDFQTVGRGGVNLRDNQIELNLKSDVHVPDSYFSLLNGLNKGNIYLNTSLKGDVSTRVFRGRFNYRVEAENDVLARGSGPYTLDDQLFQTSLFSADLADPFRVNCRIENMFSDPNFNILDVKNFPVKEFTANPMLANWITGRQTHFYIAGPYASLIAKMKIVGDYQADEHLSVIAYIKDIFTYDQKFTGEFEAATEPTALAGDYAVDFSQEGMQIDIRSKELLDWQMFVGATPASPLSGRIKLAQLDIRQYVQSNATLSKMFSQGNVAGAMGLSGTLGNPKIDFDVASEDIVINNVGYYNMRVSGELSDHLLRFENAWVRLNGDSVFAADFSWDVLKDSMNLNIEAKQIESNFVAETIFRNRDAIRGSADYAIVAKGSINRPRVFGNLSIRDGQFAGNPVNLISVVFEDSLLAGTSFWDVDNHLMKIHEFLYLNEDEYLLNGNGLISIDPYGPLDFQATLEGNVLAELPQIEPYFMNPQSEGTLFAHVKGTRASPYFEDVRLKIEDGSLEFDGVVPKLTNLRVDVELANAANFVNIRAIEGNVGGHWARLHNIATAITSEGDSLESWEFEDLRLDFGILVLETKENGIPLSFPGLMREGEEGRWAVSGKKPGEAFYLAGPVTLPLVRGKVTMYDARVTFPFIGMEYVNGEFVYADSSGFEDSRVVDFLYNMRWDIETKPGNNNRYFVDMPAYVGEVSMDLHIDDNSPGFEFTGRLIDDSFRIIGSAESSRGRVEYLDVNFRVDRFGVEFNQYEIFPEVYGKAYTTVRDSSSNFPRDIYLKLYVTDPLTGADVSKGRWEDFRFKLESRDQVYGETQESILAYLGYSVQNFQYKAGEVGLTMTENFLIRPLFRPIERQLERGLRLDYVRLRSQITQNLFYLSFQDRAKTFTRPTFYNPNPFITNDLNPALALLQSMELSMGKYVAKEVYFSYTGQLVTGYEESRLGVNHTFGMEYRILYNLLLQLEYSKFQFNPFYNEAIDNDLRVIVRHSINF